MTEKEAEQQVRAAQKMLGFSMSVSTDRLVVISAMNVGFSLDKCGRQIMCFYTWRDALKQLSKLTNDTIV